MSYATEGDRADSAMIVTTELRGMSAEIRRLQGVLADCYRATGADPDGNEDWRLADKALDRVRSLRKVYDSDRETR